MLDNSSGKQSEQMHANITRSISLSDKTSMNMYRQTPERGPKVLFFCGGTALRAVSAELVNFTHNSIHIITPIDSGGSSAVLKGAFQMPAIGDIRNRLMALSDQKFIGDSKIIDFLNYRFPKDQQNKHLRTIFDEMISGCHHLVSQIPEFEKKMIQKQLADFRCAMPEYFDLRGACIGNLILAGGYLSNRRRLKSMINMFSKLVNARGIVSPITDENLNLVAELEDGRLIVGQHLITGKEVAPIREKVKSVYLSLANGDHKPVQICVGDNIRSLIEQADLICYPMGSFFSSLISNLLPEGVGGAISKNRCPKIFIPSTGIDPECYGMTVAGQLACLLKYLRRDDPDKIDIRDVLDFILVDTKNGLYPGTVDIADFRRQGIQTIDCHMVSKRSDPMIDEKLLVPILLSLV